MKPVLPIAGLVLPLILSGCISIGESADIGRPPPVLLETQQAGLRAPDRTPRNAAIRAKVRQAITDIGAGDVQSVRVRIYARSAHDGEQLRRMLVGMGADPARLTVEPGRSSANRLVLTRAVAETAPCAAAIAPTYAADPLPSLMSLARCTQTNNLVDMLVDPGDLVAPPRLTPEDGQYLVNGVEAWRNGHSAALPSQDGSASGGSSGGIGGASSTANTGAATLAYPAAPTMPATSSGQ
jgi:type IV pilus biogenesis protein CpaD/CtpE